MGFSGIGIWQLLIILAIVVLIFGTKRLPGAAKDLGSAITNFREGMKRSFGVRLYTCKNECSTPVITVAVLRAEAFVRL